MSVILDALHRARGDRRGHPAEPGGPHDQAVARVLDATALPGVMAGTPRPSRRREWLLAFGVITFFMVLFALAGGAFLLIYQQLVQIDKSNLTRVTADNAAIPAGTSPITLAQPAAGTVAPISPVVATPVPLSELPVETPVTHSQANSVAAATRADFTLGSIVCENNDCIASLNGRSVRVGDTIKDYRIVSIESTSIKLQGMHGQGELALSLFD